MRKRNFFCITCIWQSWSVKELHSLMFIRAVNLVSFVCYMLLPNSDQVAFFYSLVAFGKTTCTSISERVRTNCRLQTGYKIQTADRVQNADCRPGTGF